MINLIDIVIIFSNLLFSNNLKPLSLPLTISYLSQCLNSFLTPKIQEIILISIHTKCNEKVNGF